MAYAPTHVSFSHFVMIGKDHATSTGDKARTIDQKRSDGHKNTTKLFRHALQIKYYILKANREKTIAIDLREIQSPPILHMLKRT